MYVRMYVFSVFVCVCVSAHVCACVYEHVQLSGHT